MDLTECVKKLKKFLPELNENQLGVLQQIIDEAYQQGILDGS